MKVVDVPGDIIADAGRQQIIIYEYLSAVNAIRERSVLSKNAISLVVKGQKTICFAGETVYTNDAEIHFMKTGNCIASMDLSRQKEFHSILIFFEDAVLTNFFIKHEPAIKKATARVVIAEQPYNSLRKDAFIRHYMDSLRLMLHSGATISPAMKALKLEELLLHLLENYPAYVLSLQTAQGASKNRYDIRRVVETNVTNNLSVEELAFLCNMSTSTFKRQFFKIYQKSPISWFLQQRMQLAARLLKQHNEKPGEVFFKVGYENHTAFSKAFRKYHGISPKGFQAGKMNAGEQLMNA